MAACVNHSWIETDTTCARCQQPFCDACLVEFLGQRYCGPCRDVRLQEIQGPRPTADAPLAGTNVVDIGGWLNSGWLIIQQDLSTFALAGLVASVLSLVSCYVCLGPLYVGLLMMCFRKMTYGHVEFSNLWDGFKRFGNSFLLLLLVLAASFGVSFVLMIPLIAMGVFSGNSTANSPAGLAVNVGYQLASYVISALLQGVIFFAFPHVAARNVNPIEALSASWNVFRRNPVMFCLAGLVFQLVGSLGVIACCVGIFVTMPLMLAATAKAYADHFGLQGWDVDLAPSVRV